VSSTAALKVGLSGGGLSTSAAEPDGELPTESSGPTTVGGDDKPINDDGRVVDWNTVAGTDC